MAKLQGEKTHAHDGGGRSGFPRERSAVSSAPPSVRENSVKLRPGPKKSGSKVKDVAKSSVPAAGIKTKPPHLAAALGVFDKATGALGLRNEDKAKFLHVGRTKYSEIKKDPSPELDEDCRDRLGYFLAIYELSGRLVGSAEAWLKAPNRAPLFAGRSPLDQIEGGRIENLLATLSYLKSTYGGWA